MTWEVFYTPHTDDETIGMAGSIQRARRAGNLVRVVLVTDNLPSARGLRLFPNVADVAAQRRSEWRHAMKILGANELDEWNLSEVEMLADLPMARLQVFTQMQMLHETAPVCCHHTVWGEHDVHVTSGLKAFSHDVCAQAIMHLHCVHPYAHVQLHGVYIYSRPREERTAPMIIALSRRELTTKRAAMNCYRPSVQCIGYGYRSVPELFDSASLDPREFIIDTQSVLPSHVHTASHP